MRDVVLDSMHRAAKSRSRQMHFEQLRDALARFAISQPAQNESGIGTLRKKIGQLLAEMCAAVLIHRDMVDVGERRTRCGQTIGDGLAGKSGPMLDAAKPLFLGGRHQLAVSKECRG